MANDSQFTELLLRPAPIMTLLDHPKVQGGDPESRSGAVDLVHSGP
jgi:hypothetical protein